MAQFDVHRNPGKHKDAIPFVVIVQSSLYDHYRRRIVVPLVRQNKLDTTSSTLPLNPEFEIEHIKVVLHPLEMVSVSLDQLGEKVASLTQEGDVIALALDEIFTRAWA